MEKPDIHCVTFEQIILLYNKMLKSNNQYEDFVETNIRYEIYQLEVGKMPVRLLKPEEWAQGIEDEVYQLFETRLQTIKSQEIQGKDPSKNRTRTFKNFRLVWKQKRMRIKGTKYVSRVMMMTTNELQNDIVVWKETTGNSYKSSTRLEPDQLNKFAILANIKGRSQEYIEFWWINNIVYYPVINQLETTMAKLSKSVNQNKPQKSKVYNPIYLSCTQQRRRRSKARSIKIQDDFERIIYRACTEYMFGERTKLAAETMQYSLLVPESVKNEKVEKYYKYSVYREEPYSELINRKGPKLENFLYKMYNDQQPIKTSTEKSRSTRANGKSIPEETEDPIDFLIKQWVQRKRWLKQEAKNRLKTAKLTPKP